MCVDQQTLVILFFRQTKHFVTHKFQTFTGLFLIHMLGGSVAVGIE